MCIESLYTKKSNNAPLIRLANRRPDLDFSETVYEGASGRIKVRCKKCNHVWNPLYIIVRKGSGCPQCYYETKRLDPIKAISILEELHPNIDFSKAVFKGTPNRIDCSCKICGHTWQPRYKDIKQGRGCPSCVTKAKTHEPIKAIQYLKDTRLDIDFSESIYIKSTSKIKCVCKKCKHTWFACYTNIKSGKGCPNCNKSQGETFISNLLLKSNIEFKEQFIFKDCKAVHYLKFDFYIPSLRTAIEVQGRHHYEPDEYFGGWDKFLLVLYRDNCKKCYCADNNIKLIHIDNTYRTKSLTQEELYKLLKI